MSTIGENDARDGLSRPGLGRGFVAVVGGLLLIAFVAQATAPSGATAPEPEIVPVVATDLVCPLVAGGDDRRTTRVTAVTPELVPSEDAGRLDLGTARDPDRIAVVEGDELYRGVTIAGSPTETVGRAFGGRAPGLAMDQRTLSGNRSDHGLSALACTEPTNDAWFVGTASNVGQSSRLYLTNTEPTPATVDVTIHDAEGRVSAPRGQALVVPARSRRTIRIDRLAPGAGSLAVRVTATSGRVGAAVRDTTVNGLQPRGSEWVPASAPPTERVVVPGLRSGAGTRSLTLFAPGEGVATVRVSVIGREGAFVPTGAGDIEVDRGRVARIDLGEALVEDDTAVLVESAVPVVAGVRWVSTGGSIPDLAFSAGTPALDGTAVVAGLQLDAGYSAALMVTAPEGAATVSYQQLVRGVPSGPVVEIDVAAGTTVKTGVGARRPGEFQLVLDPDAGGAPVHVALVRSREAYGAAGVVITPVQASRITVPIADARPDSDVGLGR